MEVAIKGCHVSAVAQNLDLTSQLVKGCETKWRHQKTGMFFLARCVLAPNNGAKFGASSMLGGSILFLQPTQKQRR